MLKARAIHPRFAVASEGPLYNAHVWIITSWDDATGRGTITSQLGDLPFDMSKVARPEFFDGIWPGDSAEVSLTKSPTGYVVASLIPRQAAGSLTETFSGGTELVVFPKQAYGKTGEVLPVRATGSRGTRWVLFFDPLRVDCPPNMKSVTRMEWREWYEVDDEGPALAQKWGVDADDIGGEIASFYDSTGAALGHVLFANALVLWRNETAPPGISI